MVIGDNRSGVTVPLGWARELDAVVGAKAASAVLDYFAKSA